MKEGKKPMSWKIKLLIVLGAVLALLLVAVLGLYIWADSFLNEIDRIDPTIDTYSDEQLESLVGNEETIEKDPVVEQAETIFSSQKVINICLLARTDAVMMVLGCILML